VEDNPEMRTHLREHLSAAYEIREMENGKAGLDAARAHPPDLIIADVMMPRMNGFELVEALRNDDTLRGVPVLLLTARAAEPDAVRGLREGADDYVTKPFSMPELTVRIERLLQRRRTVLDQFRQRALMPRPDISVSSNDEAFLDRVTDAMAEHFARRTFSTGDLAAEVGLSPRQLQRKLKRLTGETPSSFLRTYRLQYAAELLRDDAGTISEIAYRVGFGTPDTFSRHFRERYGCPPSKFPDAAD
jgi:DNA-binding response OmpR family regulator